MLVVGAFPPAGWQIFGGMVTSCTALLKSSLPDRAELFLLDSTQVSNPPPSFPVRMAYALRRLCVFVARIEQCRPDVILLFASLGASLMEKGAMAWYARLRGIPAVMFPRGGGIIDDCERSGVSRAWVRAVFGGARKIFCQSPHWQHFAVDVLGFDRLNAPVITNWTATAELLAVGKQREPAKPDDPVRLLFVGWLDREKGMGELLEACRALPPEMKFTLVIAGEGNMSSSAREAVSRAGLDDRVRFMGWVEGPALVAAFAEAQVLVLPSWAEGLPNAMIEAMAARLAVVITRVGSVPDVVTDGVHALLVPPRDAAALKVALTRVIEDPVLRQRLATAGHELAATRFDVESAVEAMVQEFSALLPRAAKV